MNDVVSFLREKLAGASLGALLFSQFEIAVMLPVSWIPGIPGFVLRSLVYKIIFKRLAGLAWIQPGVTFVETNRLSIGKTFGVNTGTYINAVGGITIGDFVLIGSSVTISSGRHPIDGRLPPVFTRPVVPGAIAIEDDVWIGAGAVIMPGIRLRRGTVVGANAVVTKDTEEYAVVVGAPARMIRKREPG